MSRQLTRALWSAALLLLAAALALFNLPGASPRAAGAPPGCEPGQQLPDFTLAQTDGTLFTLSEHRGKAVFLNLWATWCGPCVKELPWFDRLQREHPGEVAVLAIHSDLVTLEEVEDFLARHDYGIAFAVDTDGGVIRSLNGSTRLPQTVVLDPGGVVIYNQEGSVTYEALEELLAKALGGA